MIFIKNINYGMSKKNKSKRWVIPYARKDTPLESSNFSSILITLVLSIKYFQENEYKLEEEDCKNIFNSNNRFITVDTYSLNVDGYWYYVRQKLENFSINDRSCFKAIY